MVNLFFAGTNSLDLSVTKVSAKLLRNSRSGFFWWEMGWKNIEKHRKPRNSHWIILLSSILGIFFSPSLRGSARILQVTKFLTEILASLQQAVSLSVLQLLMSWVCCWATWEELKSRHLTNRRRGMGGLRLEKHFVLSQLGSCYLFNLFLLIAEKLIGFERTQTGWSFRTIHDCESSLSRKHPCPNGTQCSRGLSAQLNGCSPLA